MPNKQQYKVFLNLSLPEIEMVSEDLELYFEGFTFYYAIDTFDLVHFFLPYLDKLEFTEEHLTALAHQAIAYEHFFSDTNLSSIVLMEAYDEEIEGVKRLFLHKIKSAFELAKNIDNLREEIEQIINTGKASSEVYRTNYDLFFLLVILSQRKKELKEVTFLNFLKQKAHVYYLETGNEEFDIVANDAIEMDLPRAFCLHLQDQFVQHSAEFLRTLTEEELFRYMHNTYTDIEVIQRLLETNETMFNDERFRKTVFFYLSSTPSKSPVLFELVEKHYGGKYTFMERFADKQRGIHRNIFQVYLLRMLIEEYKDPEMPRKIMELIKIIKQAGDAYTGDDGAGPAIQGELDKLLDKYSNSIENHFFMKLLNQGYRETLEELISPAADGPKNLQKVVTNSFKGFVDYEENELESLDIAYALAKFGQLNKLKEAILIHAEKGNVIKVRYGLDIVKFNYHHLPYLLYLYDNKTHREIPSFFTAMGVISEAAQETAENNFPIEMFLAEILAHKEKRLINRKTLEFLSLIFIDFLSIEVFPDQPQIRHFEMSLIKIFEKWLKRIEQIDSRRKNVRKDYKNPLTTEIHYVLLWLYRRNLRFIKIFDLERDLRRFKQDARLSHGFGLAYVSRFYHEGKRDTLSLHKAVSNFLSALDGYSGMVWSIYNPDLRKLLLKSIIGVYNSICDCYIRLYVIEGNPGYIVSGRFHLNKMKQQIAKVCPPNVVLSIPAFTESELEYYESRIFGNAQDTRNALIKIDHAIRKFDLANAQQTLMDARFKDIGELMTQYKDELVKKQALQ
ncbi:hypothetical protein [Paraflavitalea sp. CAU 1676]|uniref:hypothetical protein n=1 Tax=Paraflavitalea sp. CAU 1676 TaxID=3032598 RepID=UPI0023DAE77C|nr:hypothetical protein [Paraflavitalea sp. CAU 1676]MDF2188365.1 hypothetical protein [Paraflavitalea sp. CAU 1676]